MSDILIKNMNMPIAGQSIEIAEGMTGIIYGRLTPSLDDEWHEVIEVPTPHSRLIDADALLASENQHYEYHSDSFYVETRTIELAPVIIESEEDE